MRTVLSTVAIVCSAVAFAATGAVFQAIVAPQADDDVAGPCRYELTVPNTSQRIEVVWVIFDRGRDLLRYYGDPAVLQFDERHRWAMLLAFQCPGKITDADHGDINVEPKRGLGRTLFAALDQLSQTTGHSELTSAKLVLLGFSGTGVLAARFAGYAPHRLAAVIAADAGHFDPVGLDTLHLSEEAQAVPQLILAGSQDAISGVSRPYDYFHRHFDAGAPWTFVVQNEVPHCCIINAKALVLEWLDAVVVQKVDRTAGSFGFIAKGPSGTVDCPSGAAQPIWCRGGVDTWGGQNWSVADAVISKRRDAPSRMLSAGWMPTAAFASHWRAFVSQPSHPVMSLP
jgi:dienelactone hydrolase